ncbi:MAG: hypothetical protein KDA94_10335 [Acidimicrobiales bacterium]|nr:hypothetical protein [Acidimicrobiales bacterium]
MRVLRAIVRVWRIRGLVGAGLVVAATARWLPTPLDVPGRSGGVEWVLTPILPTIVALAGWACFGVAHSEFERVTAQPVVIRRAAAVTMAISIGVVAVVLGVGIGGAAVVGIRNLFLLVGLAQASISVAPNTAGWAMVVIPSAVCWLVGAPVPGAAPPGWAVLLHPSSSFAATVAAVAAFVVGSALYLAREVPLQFARVEGGPSR